MNLYRVRKSLFGRCILQFYHNAESPEHSGWVDVPYHKAPIQLREVSWSNTNEPGVGK